VPWINKSFNNYCSVPRNCLLSSSEDLSVPCSARVNAVFSTGSTAHRPIKHSARWTFSLGVDGRSRARRSRNAAMPTRLLMTSSVSRSANTSMSSVLDAAERSCSRCASSENLLGFGALITSFDNLRNAIAPGESRSVGLSKSAAADPTGVNNNQAHTAATPMRPKQGCWRAVLKAPRRRDQRGENVHLVAA
jgi:hypothetical protein